MRYTLTQEHGSRLRRARELVVPPLRDLPIGNTDFLASALTLANPFLPTDQFAAWFDSRLRANNFAVAPIPFAQLDQWGFHPDTGNLVHASGRFFSIEGIRVQTNHGPVPQWSQPIINQPEIGILGILTRQIDGVLFFLMQAKMEPGNLNTLQLAPTVQATRSNYTRIHRGSHTKYLEYFIDRGRAHVLVDVLQSEQGARFFRKRNRNMVIQVDEEVPLYDDYCWLTLGQIHALLRIDNLLNMDARTVLSCIPFVDPRSGDSLYISSLMRHWRSDSAADADERFKRALVASYANPSGAHHTIDEILSWFTELKTRYELDIERIPLRAVEQWHRDEHSVSHEQGRYFSVMAVSVTAGSREVTRWTQPLVKPRNAGIVAFLARRIRGVLHLLVQAKVEPGNFDILEMAPTVQCITGNYLQYDPAYRPAFLDYVLSVPAEQIRFDTYQSEEGGRFYQEQNRSLIIEVDESFSLAAPPNYIWMTLSQIKELIRYNNYLNVEARSLISCIGCI